MIRRGIGVGSFVAAGGGGTDADAQAFITAAAITDVTQQSAINTLVVDLKAYGIWTKMKALYPFVGGTASAHKFNLKDPRDLDAAFRLVFSGGGTHSSTGYLSNGVNGFADTFLTPSTSLALNNTHISFYSRTNSISLTPVISDQTGSGTNLLNIFPRYSVLNDIYFRVNSAPTASVATNTSSSAFYLANRITSSETRNLRNSTRYVQSQTSGTLISSSLWISRQGSSYGDRECAFASIGDGLTDTEAANFYTAVQAYQTTLSRNV
jgi:hypothetical protein